MSPSNPEEEWVHRDAHQMIRAVEREIGRGILGQEGLIRGLLLGLLADGHILIEGVPGLGKTRAVMTDNKTNNG